VDVICFDFTFVFFVLIYLLLLAHGVTTVFS